MAAPSEFVPKQAMPFDGKLFDIIGADETLTIAKHEMALLPPFPPGSVIHDTACGLGPVTQSILATTPPSDIKFYAPDIAPPMVGIYNQKLTFPDDMFSHTSLSFGLPIIDDPVAAAKEVYRTLAPGGTAVTAFWLQIPQGECAQETRMVVYGPDANHNIKIETIFSSLQFEPKPQHKD